MARLGMAVLPVAGLAVAASAQVTLLEEDFESVPFLRAPVDETGAPVPDPDNVWTDAPPANWYVDKCDTPAGGVRDWRGWNFSDNFWWSSAAGDQQRTDFVFPLNPAGLSEGICAVADPDEWDDASHDDGTMNTTLYSPEIAVDGVSSMTIQFDSSWRPEDDQKARLKVSFDGNTPVVVFTWVSDPADGNFKPDATNETVSETIAVPGGASKAVVQWEMYEAGNDWWWAIDNVLVTGDASPSGSNSASQGLCPPEPPLCRNKADFDGDNLITTNDFFAFLAEYQNGCP